MEKVITAIVENPFDPEATVEPFGKRWGGQVIHLHENDLSALQAGKTIAIDVMDEYVAFLQLEK